MPLLAYQRMDVEAEDRFRWCCWARQTGKSFTKSLRRLLRGLARGRTQILLSAGERQSRELMTKVAMHCKALNIACRQQGAAVLEGTRYQRLTIELPGGIRVIGLPANSMTARGFTGDVLLDEFAMHREDREIWAAIFPSVLRGGGELDVASTPKGVGNLFAELGDNPRFARSVVTLDDAIAAGLNVDAEAMRASMHDEELYRQEFGCEFLEEGSAFLTHAQIAAIEDASLEKELDVDALTGSAGRLFAGVDVGRHRDLTVMWVVELCDGVLVTRGVRESVNEPFAGQEAALKALLTLPRLVRCAIDATGVGMMLAENAVAAFGASRVEAVTFTAAIKDELATRLRRRIEEGTIRIPADTAIRNDLHAVRRTLSASGPARYAAMRSASGHADRFWAAALAVRAAGGDPGTVEVLHGEGLRYARRGIW